MRDSRSLASCTTRCSGSLMDGTCPRRCCTFSSTRMSSICTFFTPRNHVAAPRNQHSAGTQPDLGAFLVVLRYPPGQETKGNDECGWGTTTSHTPYKQTANHASCLAIADCTRPTTHLGACIGSWLPWRCMQRCLCTGHSITWPTAGLAEQCGTVLFTHKPPAWYALKQFSNRAHSTTQKSLHGLLSFWHTLQIVRKHRSLCGELRTHGIGPADGLPCKPSNQLSGYNEKVDVVDLGFRHDVGKVVITHVYIALD